MLTILPPLGAASVAPVIALRGRFGHNSRFTTAAPVFAVPAVRLAPFARLPCDTIARL